MGATIDNCCSGNYKERSNRFSDIDNMHAPEKRLHIDEFKC